MKGRHIIFLFAVALAALVLGSATVKQASDLPAANIPNATTTAAHPTSTISGNVPVGPHATTTSVPVHDVASSTTPTVSLKIIEPDGTRSFDVALHAGDTLCDNLKEAKAEGEIRARTLDDSYLPSFLSLYVREINGHSNNWTFTVDGTSPRGCSLYQLHAGDSIVWKFGE